MFAYCINNPTNGCDPCGTCFHRWDFWNDCEKCAAKNLADYLSETVDEFICNTVELLLGSTATSMLRTLHYSRNIINESYTKEDLDQKGYKPLGPDEDKFHQNNQIGGRNSKYVIGTWFSSENVFYADGTINNTPEDMGTLNVYYGDNWLGKYIIHGIYDVVPYIIWGNSENDSTTTIERIFMGGQ